MEVDVISLNGGSSSGKSSLAACLQKRAATTWLTLGIDDLIRALSHGLTDSTAAGFMELRPHGSISIGSAFPQGWGIVLRRFGGNRSSRHE